EYAYFQGANPTAEQIRQFQLENGLLDPLPVRAPSATPPVAPACSTTSSPFWRHDGSGANPTQ
ncbi:hypothetical protein AB0K48_58620, partial [Nonomuraea sp. NPDC055795]